MIGAAAAYMAGLFFASFFSDIPLLVITAVILAAALVTVRRYGFKAADYGIMAVFFTAAVMAFGIHTAVRYRPAVKMDGRTGSFRGEVAEVSRYEGGNSSYILKGRINGRIPAKVTFYTGECEADIGDVIDIGSCSFSVPSKDYLFDGESYYRSDGVFLSIGKASDITAVKCEGHRLKRAVDSYREQMIFDFRSALGAHSGQLLAGMVFGEKRGLDENIRTAVYRVGIGHMLAVSGLHVSVAVFVLMRLLKRLRVNKYAAFVLMECLLLFLVTLANYPVSAVRAAIMMNFVYAAGLFRRQNDTFNALAGAVLLICVIQPYVIYDEGFILSVAGTFGIGVAAPCLTKDMPKESIAQKALVSLATMLCTTVCVFPFSLLFFDETSLISPVTNVLLVPLCSVSMAAGLLYALTGGAVDVLFISDVINGFILNIADSAARIGVTHFSCGSRPVVYGLLICAVIVVFSFAVFRSRRFTCIITAAAFVFLFTGAGIERTQRNDGLIIAVLGKGSNSAVVVSCHGSAHVVDLSGNYRSAAYVRKYLTRNGIERVEDIVLTNRIQSSYASYSGELDLVDTGKWLAADSGIPYESAGAIDYTDGEPVVIGGEDYTMTIDAGVLTVEGCGGKVVFEKGSAEQTAGALNVRYGRISDDERVSDDTIYTDKGNNFEIWLSESGSFDIRRL